MLKGLSEWDGLLEGDVGRRFFVPEKHGFRVLTPEELEGETVLIRYQTHARAGT